MISGRGADFRFIKLRFTDRYGHGIFYTFFLHNRKMLIGDFNEANYTIDDTGALIIYRVDRSSGRSSFYPTIPIEGEIIEAAHPMVVELKQAIAEDAIDEMLRVK